MRGACSVRVDVGSTGDGCRRARNGRDHHERVRAVGAHAERAQRRDASPSGKCCCKSASQECSCTIVRHPAQRGAQVRQSGVLVSDARVGLHMQAVQGDPELLGAVSFCAGWACERRIGGLQQRAGERVKWTVSQESAAQLLLP